MDTLGPMGDTAPQPPERDSVSNPDYWFSLIDEKEAGKFLDFSSRHMQGLRYRGGGPRFLRLSARCVRYRRWDLWEWAGEHLRTSTSDLGPDHSREPAWRGHRATAAREVEAGPPRDHHPEN